MENFSTTNFLKGFFFGKTKSVTICYVIKHAVLHQKVQEKVKVQSKLLRILRCWGVSVIMKAPLPGQPS